MRRIALVDAPELAELARDVPGPQGSGPPLLCAGMRLDAAMLARAAGAGVSAVWVNDELGEGIEPPAELDPAVRTAVLRTLERIFGAARAVAQSGRQLDLRVLRDAQHAAAQVTTRVRAGVRDAGEASGDLRGHHHAVRVAVLGLSVGLTALAEPEHDHGRADERLEERLTLFGAGLLLHDLGKELGAARGFRDRGSAGGDDARHAIAAEALMPASLYPLQVRAVVRSHHEHWDGSGRPDRKAGTAIHRLARIAAVANAYDTLVTGHGGGAPLPTHVAVREIEAGAGSLFDPAVVVAFGAVVLPYPPGAAVGLPDGRAGVVVRADAGDRLRPLVRVPAGRGYEEIVADLGEQFSSSAAPRADQAA